jgi:hypothetical protein
MVVGVNAYREICTLHLAGQILVDKKLVLRLSHAAADKAKKIVDKIKAVLWIRINLLRTRIRVQHFF